MNKTAAIYLRVSSIGQVNTAHDPEGYSIPGQREACQRYAEQLNASVIREYVEPGKSGTNTNRPALQRMLSELEALKPDYVIFYDLSRVARDDFDALWLLREIEGRGCKLESTLERVDDTPAGKLLYTVMAGVNAFRSRGDAEKVKLGLERKHQTGGSHGPARLGYLNVREQVGERQVASIALDPERAPLIRLLFDLAASGDMTLTTLTDLLNEAGLRTRPTATRPSRPVARTSIHRILRDDYYTGIVTRNGIKRPGRHEAIVDRDTFERVQAVLDAHRAGGERSKKHSHYLNGSVYCRVCGARLGYGNHRGKLGGYYEYYSCLSRVRPSGPCGNPYASVERVEHVVAELHADRPWLNEHEQEALRAAVREFVTAKAATAQAEAERHSRRLHELTAQQQKLVQLYYRDAISVEVLQAEQLRIADEQAQVERWQTQAVAQVDDVMQALDDALLLLCEPGEAYEQADPSLKKILNRAIFQRILIQVVDRRVEAEGLPQEVFTALVETAQSLGIASDQPPDVLLQAHQAVRTRTRRTIRLRPSTNEPQPAFLGSGFARRADGGEGGIRTRDGGLSPILA